MESIGKRCLCFLLMVLATLSFSLPPATSMEKDDVFPMEITNWGLPLYHSVYQTSDGNLLAAGVDFATQIDGETLKASSESTRMDLYQLESDFTVYHATLFTGKDWLEYYTLKPSGKRFVATSNQMLFLDAEGTHGYRVGAGKDKNGNNLYKFCVYDYLGKLKWEYLPKNQDLIGGMYANRYFLFIACGNVVFVDGENMVALDSKTGEEVISTKIAQSKAYYPALGMKKNARYAVIDTNVVDFKQKKVFAYQEKFFDFCANVQDDGFEVCTNNKFEFAYKRYDSIGNLVEEQKYAVNQVEIGDKIILACLSDHVLCYISRMKNDYFVYDFKKSKVLLDFRLFSSYSSFRYDSFINGKNLYIWANNILTRFDLETETIVRTVELIKNEYFYANYKLDQKFILIEKKRPDESSLTLKLQGLTTQSEAEFQIDGIEYFNAVPYKHGFLVSNTKLGADSSIKFIALNKENTDFTKLGIEGYMFWMSNIDGQVCAMTYRNSDKISIYELWLLDYKTSKIIKTWKTDRRISNFIDDTRMFAFQKSTDEFIVFYLTDPANINERSFSFNKYGFKNTGYIRFKKICDDKLIFSNDGIYYIFNIEKDKLTRLKGDQLLGITNDMEIVMGDFDNLYFYKDDEFTRKEEYQFDLTYPFVSGNGNFVGFAFLFDKHGKKQQEFGQFDYGRNLLNIPREFWPVMSCCDNESDRTITNEWVAQSRKAKVCGATVSCGMVPRVSSFSDGVVGKMWKFELPNQDEYAFYIDDNDGESIKDFLNPIFVKNDGDYLIFTISNAFLMPDEAAVDSPYKTKYAGKQVADADSEGNIVSGFVFKR